jgi:DNA-binding CsgD family transcriptional regulator
MNHRIGWILHCLVFLTWVSLGYANQLPKIRNFLPEAMQAANQNWSVTQTPSRHIYSGNTSGIVKFDGARWELLPLPDRQIVRTVAADSSGRIFWGGFGAFGFLTEGGDAPYEFTVLSKAFSNQKADTEEIWHILIAGGKIFFQSFSTLYEYNYKSVREIELPGNIMFIQAAGNMILVPVIGRGIFVKTADDRFDLLPGTHAIGKEIIVGITELGEGKLLIGTERRGLFIWEKGTLLPWDAPVQTVLKGTRLNKMLCLSDGSLAFGSVGEGLWISDSDGRILYHIHKDQGLQNNTVLSLFEDADGNLWSGLDKGLDLVILKNPLRFSIDPRGSIGAVYTAALDSNFLYLGSNQGLFFRQRNKTGAFSGKWTAVSGISGQVWELSSINGKLICGHNDGTFVISGGTAQKISDVTGGWVIREVPWDSTLWIQGTYTGLVVFRSLKSGGLVPAMRIEGFTEPVEYMEFDEAGNLWVVHPYRGLHRIVLEKNSLLRIADIQKYTQGSSIPTEYNLILRKFSGRLLLHAGEDFLEWDSQRSEWTKRAALFGYGFNGKEKDLFPIGDSAFFCVYADYVIQVSPQRKLAMQIRMVPDRANILSFDSNSWLFCLEDGFAEWKPESQAATFSKNRPPIIHTAYAMGRKGMRFVSLSGGKSQKLEFLPDENQISLFFSAMVFDGISQYRWRMEGLQEEWSDWSDQSRQDFSFLPPGQYRLEVQSDLSDEITRIAFSVKPRWHQTWWFRALLSLLLSGGMFVLLFLFQRRMEQNHNAQLMERERQIHEQQIEARNRQLQEDVLKKARDLANSTMQLIRKNEILMDVKQRLYDLQKNPKNINQVNRLLDQELSSENDWAVFEENFNSVHEAFLRKLKQNYPELTPGDLRLAAYLRMNLSSKEIAPLLGISLRGVENKRYRLRKKMELPSDENLVEILMEL